MNTTSSTAARTPGVYRQSEKLNLHFKKWLTCCFIFICLLFTVKINAQQAPCTCQGCVLETVFNGTFATPICNLGYFSDYTVVPCGPPAPFGTGNFTEAAATANFYHPAWAAADHTGGGTRYLLVNGQSAPGASMRAWYQTINVTKGETYCFSAWVLNAATCGPGNIPPTVELRTGGVGGQLLATIGLGCGAPWMRICGQFVATVNGPLEIDVVLTAAGVGGIRQNKLAVDDISCVKQGHLPTAAFTYSPNPVNCNQNITFTNTETDYGSDFWDFGDGTTSTSLNPTHVFTYCATFTVTHIITTACGSDTVSEQIAVSCIPDPDECCITCGQEIVVNGDFSAPNCFLNYTSFLGATLPCNSPHYIGHGNYTEASDAGSFNSAWQGFDHTCNGSRFMLIDGPNQNDPFGMVWEQVATVTPGKTYCFSAWVKNACIVCGPDPTMSLMINNNGWWENLSWDTLPRGTTEWTKMCGTFTATGTTVTLQVLLYTASTAGNDALLDDISLKEVCGPRIGEPEATPNASMNVFPIPVKQGSTLQVTYISPSEEKVHVQIFDLAGKMVSETMQHVITGPNVLQISTEGLEQGAYLISIEGSQGKLNSKFLVE